MAKESRLIRVARLAYFIARKALPVYTHPKSPHHYTFPQLAACVLLTFYLDLSYRDMEDWLLASDQVREVLELQKVPDHTTLWRTFNRLTLSRIRRMLRELLNLLGVKENIISVDSTGFRLSQASAYYITRKGKTYREWIKGAYAVGASSQMILAFRQGKGPGSDARFRKGLKRDAAPYGEKENGRPCWLLVGDAGFDGANVDEEDIIPPIRRGGNLVSPERIARKERVDAARLDGIYGQRWKSETVHSVIKRKFGDDIRSRSTRRQMREPAIKGLVYALHRCFFSFINT